MACRSFLTLCGCIFVILPEGLYFLSLVISRVVLCYVPVRVPEQFLSVPKVARISRGLGANIPKLKSRPSGFPGLIKPIPQHPVGERLAAFVLN